MSYDVEVATHERPAQARPRGQGGEDEHREPGVVRGRRALGGRAGRAAGRHHAPLPRGAADPLRRVRAAPGTLRPGRAGDVAALARDDSAFWFASRPFSGGHTFPPDRHDSGRLGLDVDWRVLEADPRWRETVAGLFAAAAAALGAFYAGWVEPGWNVSANNRLSISAGRKTRGAAYGAAEGLPAEPAWLAWFGGRYREPVAAALADAAPRAKLSPLPLPPELVRPG